jgi:hypothetical protein
MEVRQDATETTRMSQYKSNDKDGYYGSSLYGYKRWVYANKGISIRARMPKRALMFR